MFRVFKGKKLLSKQILMLKLNLEVQMVIVIEFIENLFN